MPSHCVQVLTTYGDHIFEDNWGYQNEDYTVKDAKAFFKTINARYPTIVKVMFDIYEDGKVSESKNYTKPVSDGIRLSSLSKEGCFIVTMGQGGGSRRRNRRGNNKTRKTRRNKTRRS